MSLCLEATGNHRSHGRDGWQGKGTMAGKSKRLMAAEKAMEEAYERFKKAVASNKEAYRLHMDEAGGARERKISDAAQDAFEKAQAAYLKGSAEYAARA